MRYKALLSHLTDSPTDSTNLNWALSAAAAANRATSSSAQLIIAVMPDGNSDISPVAIQPTMTRCPPSLWLNPAGGRNKPSLAKGKQKIPCYGEVPAFTRMASATTKLWLCRHFLLNTIPQLIILFSGESHMCGSVIFS